MIALALAALLAAPQAPPAETRVVEYLKANVKPGQPVVVSELYNTVFTAAGGASGPQPPVQHVLQDPALPGPAAEGRRQAAHARRDRGAVPLRGPRGGGRDAADHGVRPPHAEVHDTRRGHRRDHERGRGGDPRSPEVRQGPRADDHGLGRPACAGVQRDHVRRQAADFGVPGRETPPPVLLVHGLPAVRADLTAPGAARPGLRREGLRDRGPERGPGARDALRPTRTGPRTRRRTAGLSRSRT